MMKPSILELTMQTWKSWLCKTRFCVACLCKSVGLCIRLEQVQTAGPGLCVTGKMNSRTLSGLSREHLSIGWRHFMLRKLRINLASQKIVTHITFINAIFISSFLEGSAQTWENLEYTHLILGLVCLKNCRNFGIRILRGRLRASESSTSAESSQIFWRAPNAPWKEQVKCKIKTVVRRKVP